MKKSLSILTLCIVFGSCTTQKKLSYLNNLQLEAERFSMEIPAYRIQPRDVLYITIKAMTADGTIKDFLTPGNQYSQSLGIGQSESGAYIYGYNVDSDGNIIIPVVGTFKLKDLTLEEAKNMLQSEAGKVFHEATVECKLLNYKFTVLGEVHTPGTYTNYSNYLTILEAIGRAGGVNDYGKRNKITVLRTTSSGTLTYTVNLQDKSILTNQAYFLLPNDLIIVEPESKKIFNLNLPTYTFIITTITSAITTTLLLINYIK